MAKKNDKCLDVYFRANAVDVGRAFSSYAIASDREALQSALKPSSVRQSLADEVRRPIWRQDPEIQSLSDIDNDGWSKLAAAAAKTKRIDFRLSHKLEKDTASESEAPPRIVIEHGRYFEAPNPLRGQTGLCRAAPARDGP